VALLGELGEERREFILLTSYVTGRNGDIRTYANIWSGTAPNNGAAAYTFSWGPRVLMHLTCLTASQTWQAAA
jgi:hypothetical protein